VTACKSITFALSLTVMSRHRPTTVGSWAGVCYNLTTAIEAELLHHRQGTRTKKLEPLFATVFKDFMQRARSRHDAGVCTRTPPPEGSANVAVPSSLCKPETP
jgi:hypothetical protein